MLSGIARGVNAWMHKRHARSTLTVLARAFDGREWTDLKRDCPDWRDLFRRSAERKGVSPLELAEYLAGKLGVAILSPVPAIPFNAIAEGLVNLEEAQRGGYVPLFNDGRLVECACLEPITLPPAWRKLRIPFSISTWDEIHTALLQSEAAYHAAVEAREIAKAQELAALAEKVIELAIAEAVRAGAFELGFGPDENDLRYRFSDKDGREFQGRIDKRVGGGVMALLAQRSGEETGGRRVEARPSGELVMVLGRAGTFGTGAEDPPKVIPFPERPDEPVVSQAEPAPLVAFIDDDPVFARVLDRFLTRHGLAVRYFREALHAYEALGRGACKPDLLICDVHMPSLTGDEFVAWIRRTLSFVDLPVMMLSSDESTERKLQLYEQGADACLSKSEDPRILCAVARRLIERRRGA